MFDYLTMPDTLPEKPQGWTQTFSMHLNMGKYGHASTYALHDETHRLMPMTLQKHTKPGMSGFVLPGVQPVLTWQQLREIWPRWIERARAKQREKEKADATPAAASPGMAGEARGG